MPGTFVLEPGGCGKGGKVTDPTLVFTLQLSVRVCCCSWEMGAHSPRAYPPALLRTACSRVAALSQGRRTYWRRRRTTRRTPGGRSSVAAATRRAGRPRSVAGGCEPTPPGPVPRPHAGAQVRERAPGADGVVECRRHHRVGGRRVSATIHERRIALSRVESRECGRGPLIMLLLLYGD